jgi:tripartite-type tricarboxylate transporter receptor subunit TctC
VIENRPGAGGNIGAQIVAQSPPDGYTLVLGVTGSHGINISLHKKMPYHPLKDFEPITQATVYPNAIVVHPAFPANNLQELLALARKEPDKYVYGSDGTGTGSHLTMALLNYKAGVKMQHAPYKGSGPIVADVMGQQLPIGITGIVGVINSYKAGKLKVLALTGPKRSPAAPELPTVAEQGFPGFAGEPWSGFFAPKGTPRPIVDKLADDLIAAMRLPDVEKKMAELGTPLVGSRPDEFRAYVASEIEKWAEAVKVSGATVD